MKLVTASVRKTYLIMGRSSYYSQSLQYSSVSPRLIQCRAVLEAGQSPPPPSSSSLSDLHLCQDPAASVLNQLQRVIKTLCLLVFFSFPSCFPSSLMLSMFLSLPLHRLLFCTHSLLTSLSPHILPSFSLSYSLLLFPIVLFFLVLSSSLSLLSASVWQPEPPWWEDECVGGSRVAPLAWQSGPPLVVGPGTAG